jgi:ribosome-associated toxin RatA of RatAB toxin-antitoxin module
MVLSLHDTDLRHTVHETTVEADPDLVYALIADVAAWPHVFGPTVHVELLRDDVGDQLLHIWALANGEVRDWTSHRFLDPAARRIAFRQVVSSAPVKSMAGAWIVERRGDATHVALTHDFSAIDGDPAAMELIGTAVDRNSTVELAALKRAAETGAGREGLHFTFHDQVEIRGRAEDVFAFVDRADLWPFRLSHVSSLTLSETVPGVQRMEMDTLSPDGSVHTTQSVRLCFPERSEIRYKQLVTPRALSAHTGRWHFEQAGETVLAQSWHTVTLDPDGVRALLGPEATLDDARAKVRAALGTNSLKTLLAAKEFVESSAVDG